MDTNPYLIIPLNVNFLGSFVLPDIKKKSS